MEAFEQQKDGVLLLSRLQSGAVGLHGHESVFDQRYPQVVQLASIDPVRKATGPVRQSSGSWLHVLERLT